MTKEQLSKKVSLYLKLRDKKPESFVKKVVNEFGEHWFTDGEKNILGSVLSGLKKGTIIRRV